jgi:flagellar basal-body rod protein FlgF
MSKGMFTAVSGAVAQAARLDTISNNLANVNTPGFKRDAQVFREYLTSYEKEPSAMTIPRIPASIESFYDIQGGDKSYVDPIGTHTDFSQGNLKITNNHLDFAIEGEGYFEILTPSGVRLTRAGNFTLDGQGKLVTKQGYPVLSDSAAGADPQSRVIRLKNPQFSIGSDGSISDGDNAGSKLSVVTVGNRDALHKFGENLFGFRENLEPRLAVATNAKIQQGTLEGSNVNVVKEMTDMLTATRAFESAQQAVKAYDKMQEQLIRDVPRLK